MKTLLHKLTWLWTRKQREADLQEEFRFHLEEEAEERRSSGASEEEARFAARRDLGNRLLLQEETRSAWGWIMVEQFLQDVRYALRGMSANKTFTALAILSLALGIGANTAIFSFMDSILLRPLPVPDPQSLVTLAWHTPARDMHGTNFHDDSYDDPNGGFIGGFFSWEAFELFRGNRSVFDSVFGYQGAGNLNLTFQNQAELARTEYVSGEYFSALTAQPAAGRMISPDDDRAGAPAVAVIGYDLSESRFGGPGKATGQIIHLNSIPFTVIGVTPKQFIGADPGLIASIYIPMHTNLLLQARDRSGSPDRYYTESEYDWVVVMARLKHGITASQAQAALSGPFAALEKRSKPKMRAEELPTLVVRQGAHGLDGLQRRYAKPLYVLLGLVGLILAIACANIANLLLARAAARRREIAVRLSIGAGRFRIMRQLLTESVLLSAFGGILGIGIALWGIRALTLLLANGQEHFTLRAELNWHVLAVVAGISILTGLLFGTAPAFQATRADVIPALKESRAADKHIHGFRALRLSRVLIVSQIAITLIILVAAGLFTRTLENLESIQLGFNQDNVLTFNVNAAQAGHGEAELPQFYGNLRERFSRVPGVLSATLSNHPLVNGGMSGTGMNLPNGGKQSSHVLAVGSDFFSTMQIPLLAGRGFNQQDRKGTTLVAIVNEEFAQKAFGGADPVGQVVSPRYGCVGCSIEIVGVCGNARDGKLTEPPPPVVYMPFAQGVWPIGGMTFELRTAGNPLTYARAVREIVHEADDRLPISGMKTQHAVIESNINQEMMFARLCGAFALLALVISCVGLYATTSYNVARRSAEIGIRMALGAQRGRVVWMLLGEVVVLSAIGLAISVPCALAASKVVQSFLYDMKANDPGPLEAAAAILVATAIFAGYLPARNASRIDPMKAVRHE
ncbi:MAG TPA: ABC transporter permease [Bryobacteraceae bacterium]|nr:ABC transporter permease [Bryobacteraceae bacterium]